VFKTHVVKGAFMRSRVVVNLLVICALFFLVLIHVDYSVFAGSIGSGQVKVGTNCVMKKAEDDLVRSTNYSYILVNVKSVYPVGAYDVDNFTRCRVCLYSSTSAYTPISDVYVLTEGTGYQQIALSEGKLSYSVLDLYFSGNNEKYGAYIDYAYSCK